MADTTRPSPSRARSFVRRWLGRIGIGLAALLGVFAIYVYFASESLLSHRYSFEVRAPLVRSDPAAVARGEHFVRAVLDCAGCHGEDHGGMAMMQSGAMGLVYAGNITSGRGSVVREYTDTDWARTIRHGVSKDGRGLLMMSSDAYASIGDRDLGDAIAYLKSVPPVDRDSPRSHAGPVARMLVLFGALPFTAAGIDHARVESATTPPEGETIAYGRYLAETSGCMSCHGQNLAGQQVGPDARSANITPAAIGAWTEAEFDTAMRTGVAPGGRKLNPMMPSERAFSQLSPAEMKALWLWLRTVPPVAPAK